MTGTEIIEAFKIYYDRITSFSAPGYKESQILLFLNNAQDQFIKDKTFGDNFRPPAFEDNQKRVVDILPLTTRAFVNSSFLSAAAVYGGTAYQFNKTAVASGRGLYTVEVEAKIQRVNPTATDQYYGCDKIDSKNISRFMVSDTNKTHFLNPKWTEDSIKYYIIADSHTTLVNDVRLNIIRRPYPITALSTEYTGSYASGVMNLHMSVHQEIVDIAVRYALQAISDPRWQTKASEKQIDTQ